MIQNYINHIALVVDASGSMYKHTGDVVKVFDAEISHLRNRSVELNQETRISVYLFNDKVKNLVFDMDVMRMPSLSGYYDSAGNTALLDASGKAIEDMSKLPELYGDHAFLLYVLTDGEENSSWSYTVGSLRSRIGALPDHWTTAIMVPNSRGLHEAKKFGFSQESIQVWDVNAVKGVEGAGKSFRSAVDSYMTLRSQGVRGTRSFFKVDTAGISKNTVNSVLTPLTPSNYTIYENRAKDRKMIKPFIESWQPTKGYMLGSAYYELLKKEKIQAQKQICIQDRANGKVYAGSGARQLLGLPDHELSVEPGDFGNWRIFVQSTSVNRNIIPNQSVLVMQ